MVNENALRDALLALATDGRSNYVMLSSLLHEVTALRETLRGLDPTFANVLEQKRQAAAQNDADVVRGLVARYDDIIRRLSIGEVC